MKKLSVIIMMLIIATLTANAQPPMGMFPGMGQEQRDPAKIAQDMAKEMQLNEELSAKFIPLYEAYQKELIKIDELLPMRFPRGRNQRPSQEEMQEMMKTRETREQVTNDMRKIYDEKFLEALGEKEFEHLKTIEKEQFEKRMKEMRERMRRRGGGNGGFPGGGFGPQM